MKTLLAGTLAASLWLASTTITSAAETHPPGFVDFSKITELASQSTVDIHLKGPLLSMAARMAEGSEREAAELLRKLKLVRVNIFKLDDRNRAEVSKRIQAVRAELEAQKWEQVVSVREKNDDVGVYLKTKGEESIEGLVVTVVDGKGEAVFVNIVGEIKPEQLSMLADKFHIDPLKKLNGGGSKRQTSKGKLQNPALEAPKEN
jgi:hypothetical protein